MSIAQRVIDKCGGTARTAELVGQSEGWVYRWTYPKTKGGTGGRIPTSAQEALLKKAAEGVVDISPSDFFEVAP